MTRNMNVANMCAVMFLFLPRCAARAQDLPEKHPIYYGKGHMDRFYSAADAFDEVLRGCSRSATRQVLE